MTEPTQVRAPEPHERVGFGSPSGADPVEAGRKGGQADRSVSFTKAIREVLKEEPGRALDVARALLDSASTSKAGSTEAAKVLLDRVDGPISLGLDAFVGQDHVILLRVDAKGAPLPGYDRAPALPEGLEDMAVVTEADELDRAREAEVIAETDTQVELGQPVRAGRRALPEEDLGLGGESSGPAQPSELSQSAVQGSGPQPAPSLPSSPCASPASVRRTHTRSTPDSGDTSCVQSKDGMPGMQAHSHEPGWRPSRGEARAMREAEARAALEER